jgi:hypothetical protein
MADFKDRKSGNQKLNEKERWLRHSGRIRTPASLAENSDFTVQGLPALMPNAGHPHSQPVFPTPSIRPPRHLNRFTTVADGATGLQLIFNLDSCVNAFRIW